MRHVSKSLKILALFFLSFSNAESFEVWKSQSGHNIEAKLVSLEGGQVKLQRKDQSEKTVELSVFIAEDQKRILKHFGMTEQSMLAAGSGVEALNEAAFPIGEMHGPVQASDESSYYVYLPKSLKKGRDAPLLFYCSPSGGEKSIIIGKHIKLAELFGCILALSVESSNLAGNEKSLKHVENCIDHLKENLPIDRDRLHYTGDSGGGNMSYLNTINNKAWGILPNVGVMQFPQKIRFEVIYGLGGATDHNRFHTAHGTNSYRENGFHRMSNNGHGHAPTENLRDGFFWVTCKFFEKHGSERPDEAKDFERDSIQWLVSMKEKHPQAAYVNAIVMRENYGMKGLNEKALKSLIQELETDKDNVLYYEALLALNDFSDKHWAPIGAKGWTPQGHAGIEGALDAEKLRGKFGHLPEINKIINGILTPAPRQK